jgi:hypothetical protein
MMSDGQLFTSILHMCGDAHKSKSKKLAPGAIFMDRNIKAGFPPIQTNTLACCNTPEGTLVGQIPQSLRYLYGQNRNRFQTWKKVSSSGLVHIIEGIPRNDMS